jgi:hypothetical protein
MIETNIDLTPYKMTSIGGQVASGKSFIMGLFVDELVFQGKTVLFINSEGSPLRFDTTQPNVRCFVYWKPENIIDFYSKIDQLNEEVYVFLDSLGSINFQQSKNQYKSKYNLLLGFLQKLRSFDNVKTIYNFNYHKSTQINSSYMTSHMQLADFHIDVTTTGKKYPKEKVFLNEEYLCEFSELVLDPKIRMREKKISNLID